MYIYLISPGPNSTITCTISGTHTVMELFDGPGGSGDDSLVEAAPYPGNYTYLDRGWTPAPK